MKAPIQNLMWGVTTECESDPGTRFDLQVASYKRGLVLDWFGTHGIKDASLHAEASDLIGDFTMRLRWDEERGNGISILVAKEQLFIQEMQAFHVKSNYRLARGNASGHFKIDLLVKGQTLSIRLDGGAPVQMALQPDAAPDRGLFQLFLVDRFRGTARAKSVQTPRLHTPL